MWSETSNLREGPCDTTYMGFTKARSTAQKKNQNASKHRSESEGLQEALPLRDERGASERGASTSAAAPMHHARKTTPGRKKREGSEDISCCTINSYIPLPIAQDIKHLRRGAP